MSTGKRFISILIMGSTLALSAHSYPRWKKESASRVFRTGSRNRFLVQMMVNSCSGLFEGLRTRSTTTGCELNDKGDAVVLVKLEYKNRVSCDQGMDYHPAIHIDTKLCSKIPTEVRFNDDKESVKIETHDAYVRDRNRRYFPARYVDLEICSNEHGERIEINGESMKIKYYLDDQYIKTYRLSSASGDGQTGVVSYQGYTNLPGSKDFASKLLFEFIIDRRMTSTPVRSRQEVSYFNRCTKKHQR